LYCQTVQYFDPLFPYQGGYCTTKSQRVGTQMDVLNWKIIIVEDIYDDQQVISHMMNHYGIEVYVVQNGHECVELLQRIEPTLVITDLAMPHCDGWQTLAYIRSDARTAHIPVVAITAYDAAEVAEQAIRVGFNGYFSKPLDLQSFVSQLKAIVR